MAVADNLAKINSSLRTSVTLVAVSKTKPNALILEAYEAGQRHFGENYVQELCDKYQQLPKDIHWHYIGHLQSNKVKFIAPFVYLIHGVDSFKLLQEINKQAEKNKRIISCLLQVYIAKEESKFGFSFEELQALLISPEFGVLKHIKICGLMGMATNTENKDTIRREFKSLCDVFTQLKQKYNEQAAIDFQILSMGMSSDYDIAMEEGSNLIRIGSSIFGERNYAK